MAFLLILFPAGDALGAGQVTTPVLLLLASAGAAMLSDRRGLAGAFLGFAGILKLFPLYLLIYPLLRRDRPMLVGAAAGMLLGLLLPVARPHYYAWRPLPSRVSMPRNGRGARGFGRVGR